MKRAAGKAKIAAASLEHGYVEFVAGPRKGHLGVYDDDAGRKLIIYPLGDSWTGGYVLESRANECDTHGKKPWRGELVCARCQRVYTTHDPSLPTHGKEICACGARFIGPKGVKFSGRIHSARPCCSECFVARAGQQRGVA